MWQSSYTHFCNYFIVDVPKTERKILQVIPFSSEEMNYLWLLQILFSVGVA